MLSLLVAAMLPRLAAVRNVGTNPPTATTCGSPESRLWQVSTKTRSKVCLDGVWGWQPAIKGANAVPTEHWGTFKVPGPWPEITDYMQTECQTVMPDPSWKGVNMRSLTAAWYERDFTVPI